MDRPALDQVLVSLVRLDTHHLFNQGLVWLEQAGRASDARVVEQTRSVKILSLFTTS